MPQVRVGMTYPAGLGGISQQGLHDGQGDRLGIGQPGLQADPGPSGSQVGELLQQVVGSHVECGREGVHVIIRHTMIMDALVSRPVDSDLLIRIPQHWLDAPH